MLSKKPNTHVSKLLIMPGASSIASPQHERACIGAVLDDTSLYPTLASLITHEDFTDPFNIYAWRACGIVYEKNAQMDYLTVADALYKLPESKERFGSEIDGIQQRLRDCIPDTPITDNAEAYAAEVRSRAIRIRAMNASDDVNRIMRDMSTPLEECLDLANDRWYTSTQQYAHESSAIADSAADYYADLQTRIKSDNVLISTGFDAFDDDQGGGLLRGYTYLLVGNTGHGKTNLTLSVMRQMAQSPNAPHIASFHYEMSKGEVLENWLAMETGIYRKRLTTGSLEDYQVSDLADAMPRVQSWQVDLFDNFEQNTVQFIRRQVRALQTQKDISVVVIDGLWKLSLLDANGNKQPPRQVLNYPALMTQITNMAQELNVAVWILHQFNQGGVSADSAPRLDLIEGKTSATSDAQVVYAMKRNLADPTAPTEVYRLKDRAQGQSITPLQLDYLISHSMYTDYAGGDYDDLNL